MHWRNLYKKHVIPSVTVVLVLLSLKRLFRILYDNFCIYIACLTKTV